MDEACAIVHRQPLERGYGERSAFPLSRRCNADFDMMPGYVNPTVTLLLVAAVVLVCLAGLSEVARARRVRPDR